MKKPIPFTKERMNEIGLYLAEFGMDFVPVNDNMNTYDANNFILLFDAWYQNFIKYAETNRLITREEILILSENPDGLDDIIKEAAIGAAREIIIEKA